MSRAVSARIRQEIAEADRYRCAYCLSPEVLLGVALTIDHILPVAAGGTNDYANLCLACRRCNEFKSVRLSEEDPATAVTVSLFNARSQEWDEHFRWSDDGVEIVGRTAVGRATVIALQLNHNLIKRTRRKWADAGWHPPQTLKDYAD